MGSLVVFKDLDFRSKIEKCKQFSKMVRFWTVASKIPASVHGWDAEVEPFTAASRSQSEPQLRQEKEPAFKQFRHPAPEREALMKSVGQGSD